MGNTQNDIISFDRRTCQTKKNSADERLNIEMMQDDETVQRQVTKFIIILNCSLNSKTQLINFNVAHSKHST